MAIRELVSTFLAEAIEGAEKVGTPWTGLTYVTGYLTLTYIFCIFVRLNKL